MSAQSKTASMDSDNIEFRIETEAETLGSALDSLSVLVDEAKFHIDPDGITCRAVDPANVGMVDLEIDADAFSTYQPHGGVLGADLNRLSDVVAMADADDTVELLLNSKTRKLHISIEGLDYTLALIDPDTIRQEPDIPELDVDGEVVCEGADLSRAITAADMVSDHAAFGIDPDDEEFVVNAEGDTDDVHLELGRDDLVDLTPEPARSLFSLDYLKDVIKPIGTDDEVRLELGEEFPVKLFVAREHLSFMYMVAPRIQSD